MPYGKFLERLAKNEVDKDSVKIMLDPAGEYLKVKLIGTENENKEFKVPFNAVMEQKRLITLLDEKNILWNTNTMPASAPACW